MTPLKNVVHFIKRNSHFNMSNELYQGIFIPYSGRPEEIKINNESGDIWQKLNCKLTDHVTLWAKNYKLSLFCDDFSIKKHLPMNPLAFST